MEECKVTVETFSADHVKAALEGRVGQEAIVVAELTDAVKVVPLAQLASLDAEKIMLIRAFTPSTEVVLERRGDGFMGREVREGEGEACKYIGGQTLCFGEVKKCVGGISTVGESRIRSYQLPFEYPEKAHVYCDHRDYVKFDEDGAAYVFASRLVGFRMQSKHKQAH
jgi:CRISPR-associated protein (TIGR03984 family)